MAKIDTISLTGDNKFRNIGTESIISMNVCNTDSTDITFDLIIGPKILHKTTSTTDAIFLLKDIPVPTGSAFLWDADDILTVAFRPGFKITTYKDSTSIFSALKNQTFLIRSGSGHTADVILRRI